jgi:hypothetical protein
MEQDPHVRRAAATEGSVSEFTSRAAHEHAERTLVDTTTTDDPRERLGDVLGAVRGGDGRAHDTGKAFEETLGGRGR